MRFIIDQLKKSAQAKQLATLPEFSDHDPHIEQRVEPQTLAAPPFPQWGADVLHHFGLEFSPEQIL